MQLWRDNSADRSRLPSPRRLPRVMRFGLVNWSAVSAANPTPHVHKPSLRWKAAGDQLQMLYQIDGQLVMGQTTVSRAILKTRYPIPGTRYFAVLPSTARYRYPITGIVRTLDNTAIETIMGGSHHSPVAPTVVPTRVCFREWGGVGKCLATLISYTFV